MLRDSGRAAWHVPHFGRRATEYLGSLLSTPHEPHRTSFTPAALEIVLCETLSYFATARIRSPGRKSAASGLTRRWRPDLHAPFHNPITPIQPPLHMGYRLSLGCVFGLTGGEIAVYLETVNFVWLRVRLALYNLK